MIPAPFHYYLRVRYQECDAQLVVFNARYGDYVDIATTEFFRALGFADELASGAFDMQLVKQTTTWKAPARNNQVLEIEIAAMALGTTSFTIGAHFRIAGTTPVICEIETVYVRVDGKTLTKRPLGGDFRAALTRGTPGIAIDHAGYLARAATE
jgi:acyl-CoA thioester hydrolase